MTAYDLNSGNIMWQVPIGEVPELVAKGMRNTGSGAPRGAVVTAGGLIFTGTPDNTFRAFDRDTGKQLWEKKLELNPMGVASTYEIAGRQYVVIAAAAPNPPPAPPEAAGAAPAAQPPSPRRSRSRTTRALTLCSRYPSRRRFLGRSTGTRGTYAGEPLRAH